MLKKNVTYGVGRLVAVISIVVISLALLGWSDSIWAFTEFQISTQMGSGAPAVNGNTVVWHEGFTWDVYGYNLSTSTEFPIVADGTGPPYSASPDVSGNIVPFHYNTGAGYDIYAEDISAPGMFSVTTAAGDQYAPAISGNIVVWEDWRNASSDVYGRDLSGGGEFPISNLGTHELKPAVSGDIVVWEDRRNGGSDIYGYNVSTATPYAIITPGWAQLPAIDGNTVVWFEGGDVFGYDLSAPGIFSIATGAAVQQNPSVSGNIVVWEDNRNGNFDIYGYNLSTATEFQITANAANETTPDIDGLTVVWDGGNFIYGAVIPEPGTLFLLGTGLLGLVGYARKKMGRK